jgi:hypothetical protein
MTVIGALSSFREPGKMSPHKRAFHHLPNCRYPEGSQPMTLHAGYAASRISSKLNGSTKQFGWLQAPATKKFLPFSNFHEPRNHPN